MSEQPALTYPLQYLSFEVKTAQSQHMIAEWTGNGMDKEQAEFKADRCIIPACSSCRGGDPNVISYSSQNKRGLYGNFCRKEWTKTAALHRSLNKLLDGRLRDTLIPSAQIMTVFQAILYTDAPKRTNVAVATMFSDLEKLHTSTRVGNGELRREIATYGGSAIHIIDKALRDAAWASDVHSSVREKAEKWKTILSTATDKIITEIAVPEPLRKMDKREGYWSWTDIYRLTVDTSNLDEAMQSLLSDMQIAVQRMVPYIDSHQQETYIQVIDEVVPRDFAKNPNEGVGLTVIGKTSNQLVELDYAVLFEVLEVEPTSTTIIADLANEWSRLHERAMECAISLNAS